MVELEGTFKNHLVQSHCCGQEHIPTRPGRSNSSRLTFITSSDRALRTSLGNLFQCFTCPHDNKIVPNLQSKSFDLKPLPLALSLEILVRSLCLYFSPPYILKGQNFNFQCSFSMEFIVWVTNYCFVCCQQSPVNILYLYCVLSLQLVPTFVLFLLP